MRSYDVWMISVILIVFAACYSSDHTDIPDKAYPENIPVKELTRPSPVVVKETATSACETENESLKLEADMWRERYSNFECECQPDED